MRLKVIGVGGAGINSINVLIQARLQDVELVAVALSEEDLKLSQSAVNILLPAPRTIHHADGEYKAEHPESTNPLSNHLHDAEVILLIAGMGGSTGTRLTPLIAGMAKDAGAMVMSIVFLPFASEGTTRRYKVTEGVSKLRVHCDCLVTIPNDRLQQATAAGSDFFTMFRVADDLIRDTILGITEQGREYGDCYVSIERLRGILTKPGIVRIASGVAGGEGRARRAVAELVASPFLKGVRLTDATGIFVTVTVASNLEIKEYDEIHNHVTGLLGDGADAIWGMVIDEILEDQLKIAVLATGMIAVPEPEVSVIANPARSWFTRVLEKLRLAWK